jgi:acyl-homoserine lactone acylase PvdQ
MTTRCLLALLVAVLAGPARAQTPPPFLNILPPGQNGRVNATDAVLFGLNGTRPLHFDDQLAMYGNLVYAVPGLTDAELLTYFKDARFGVDPGDVERTETPRPGVTILRDQFGVPHIQGVTQGDVAFGAGYATAEDRLFFTDVLRHVGRGRMSEFLGPCPANIDMDQSLYRVAGYSEAELQQQIDALPVKFGALGQQIKDGLEEYTAGINQYIAEARNDATKMPAEYAAVLQTLEDWRTTDVVAVATLVQATFAAGGGREEDSAALLQALQAKHGETAGRELWRDLRHADDPEAPVTTTRKYRYPRVAGALFPGTAMPDPGSISDQNPLSAMAAAMAAAGLPLPSGLSNWLAVTKEHAAGGHPIAVMGPQTGYFAPQILMEIDLQGGGISARGAAFPGISGFVLLGRGSDFAFSATSGGSDMVDVRVEKLCNPGGGAVDPDSTHYLFKGVCTPMYERTDQWTSVPNAACQGQPQTITAHVQRTVHGPVFARATVAGQPVALALQRSTFFGEVDTATAFALINTHQFSGPKGFQKAISQVTGSFNWLYVDRDNVAFYHSGLYPVRHRAAHPDLPSWGTGEYEWSRRFLSSARHPQARNPRAGFITSWNGKPARSWRASDSNLAYGPVFRSQSLDERLIAAIAGPPITRAQMVSIMEDAGTVDLRGTQVLPHALDLIGSEPSLAGVLAILDAWSASGAHRRDFDQNNVYDDSSAVALMDEWYPRMIRAAFDPQLDGVYGNIFMSQDDRPGPVGSAYIEGYYGYLQRTFKMALGTAAVSYERLQCADGTPAGCRAALVSSLNAAVAALTTRYGSSNPATWTVPATCAVTTPPSCDQVVHTTVGIVSVPPIHWINRPTFQQVVQVQ